MVTGSRMPMKRRWKAAVRLYDDASLVAGETLTDAAGHYAFWGLLPNHTYSVKLDKPDDYLAGNPVGWDAAQR